MNLQTIENEKNSGKFEPKMVRDNPPRSSAVEGERAVNNGSEKK